jgi:hypothetical protein
MGRPLKGRESQKTCLENERSFYEAIASIMYLEESLVDKGMTYSGIRGKIRDSPNLFLSL